MNNATIKSLFTILFLGSGFLALAQEPTNYPASLAAATQSATSIKLSWPASTGPNTPSDYVILVRVVPGGTFSTPVDGTAIPNDTDLTDNLGAQNVSHSAGPNTFTWVTGLTVDTDYEFVIYPYKTGGAPNPDFKTSGSAPTATASTRRPTVTSPTVTTISDVSATLGGTVTSNGTNTLTERGTVWKTSPGVTIADNKQIEGGTGVSAFTNAVTGLPVATKIYYAAYATNIAGTSLSSESSFYTLSTVPDNNPAPANVTATAVSTGQINLAFPAASSLGHSNGYVLLRRLGADPLTTSVQDGVAPGSLALGASTLVTTLSSSATTYNDTDVSLASCTDYHYAVVPFNWDSTNPETYNYKTGSGFTIKNATTFCNSSDIILNGGTSTTLDYRIKQSPVGSMSTDGSNTLPLATFQIRDGGGSDDADNVGTTLTSVTIQFTNSSYLRAVGIFNSSGTLIGSSKAAAPTVTFSSLSLSTADGAGGTYNFSIRATFASSVTDKQPIQVSVTAATASGTGSGFSSIGSWASTTTSSSENLIDVNVSKFIIQSGPTPSSVAIGVPFALTVAAVDSKNNTDIDYTRNVDLTISGGPGVISGSATNRAFTSGLLTFTGLSINKAGSYTIDISDANYDSDYGNVTTSISVTSSSSQITIPATLNLCYGGDFQTLDDIVIKETDPAGFSTGGNFSLALPSGFIFDQNVKTAPVLAGGSDISGATLLSYPSTNVVEFSYNVTGTSNTNLITISGLKIRYPGNTAPSTSTITRSGGTASIAGDVPGTVHGNVNASLGTPSGTVSFVVQELPGDLVIDPNTTSFSVTGNAVRLIGSPTNSQPQTIFSGSGVTFTSGEYRFNPSTLSPGIYPITYTFQNNGGQNCTFTFVKQFTVYSSGINNLGNSYCTSDPTTPTLSVNQAILDAVGANYLIPVGQTKVDGFIYYDAGIWKDITNPDGTHFNPSLGIYKTAAAYWQGIFGYPTFPVGYYICGGAIACGSKVIGTYQWVKLQSAPTPSFTISDTNFCADDLPVTLTGNPVNSNNAINDKFDAPLQTASVSHAGSSPVVWSFDPRLVTDGGSPVALGSSVSFDLTYTYTDPVTLCKATSLPTNITVYARPPVLKATDITSAGGINPQICQGVQVNNFTISAGAIPGTTFTWYDNSSLITSAATGTSFKPSVDNTTAGNTDFYVTQKVGACESNKEPTPTPPLKLTVTVNGTPGQPVPDISKEYCQNVTVPPADLAISSLATLKWYSSIPTGTNTPLAVSNPKAPTASDISSVMMIDNTKPGLNTFYVTQTASGCEGIINPTTVSVTIKPLPSLAINILKANASKICSTDPVINFEATDGGSLATSSNGTPTWSGIPSVIPNPPAGTATLNPSTLNPGNYNLKFAFTNLQNCSNSFTLPLTILATIKPKLAPLDSCFGVFADLNNLSTIDNGTLLTPPATVDSTEWNFGDGTGLPFGSGAVNDGNTTGTYFSPKHSFTTTGSVFLQYTMITSDGCRVSSNRQLKVSPKPKVNFTWSSVCRDVTSSTQFNAVELTKPSAIPIKTYDWIFNVNGNLTYSSAGTGASPIVEYDVNGKDSVNLIITSLTNCKDTIQKPVFIVPTYPAITEANSYTQNFESGANGWIDGGSNSSWALGTSTGTYIKAASGKAWDTNLSGISNPNEQSWVLSPCYDLSQAIKPIISLDIWSDTPNGNDGAVLQYNTSGNIEDDANWIVLGTTNKGFNWYDESGISSSPGSQSTNDLGWTGIYGGWKEAVYKLDTLIGQSSVVFRVAFASTSPRRDGFSFDNVFIGERTRNVLVESFTNSSAAADAKNHNTIFNNFAKTSPEIVKIEYHTSFPGTDALQAANSEMNDSRTAFYGITKTANYSVDGTIAANAIDLAKTYDNRVLTPSPLGIKIDQVMDGNYVKITTTLTNISADVIKAKGLNLFTVILEKSITDSKYLGNGGDPQFNFVARQMLPTASGLEIPHDLAPLEVLVMPDVYWKTDNLISIGSNQGAIAAFVQSLEIGNKNVLQAKVVDATLEPAVTTGIESPLTDKDVKVYPNPANEALTISLPASVSEITPVRLFDISGHEIHHSNFKQGESKKVISIADFAAGVYLVQIETQNNIVRKKVIVIHD